MDDKIINGGVPEVTIYRVDFKEEQDFCNICNYLGLGKNYNIDEIDWVVLNNGRIKDVVLMEEL